jgi:hypothetical protein
VPGQNIQSARKRLTQSARQRIVVEGDLSLVLGPRSQTLCKKKLLYRNNIINILNAKVFSIRLRIFSVSVAKRPDKICGLGDQNYYTGISMENMY